MKNNIRKNIPVVNLFKAIILLILFIIPLSVSAQDKKQTHSNPLFTFEFVNTPIKQVFDYIQSKSDYVFLYYGGVVSSTQKVTVKVKKQNIETVLQQLFKNMPVSYSIKDRQIILKKKSTSPQKTSPNTITGLVTDSEGNPVIGVTIKIKGTSTGVITDLDGRYSINANSGEILVFSYIGYNTEERTIKDEASINVRMMEASVGLEDVVIIGYGQQKKESVVSSINSVKAAELSLPTRSLNNMIAGQVAGIIAIQRSGEPGNDDAQFWIRGQSSYAGGTSPLVLVDGIPRSMSDIDVDEIETFTVLKDAAATAVYGSEGANGVVLITSKRGMRQKTSVNFNAQFGVVTPTRMIELMPSYDYLEMYNEAAWNDANNPDWNSFSKPYPDETLDLYRNGTDPDLYPNSIWTDLLSKHTYNQRYTINIRGGSEKVRYFVSGAYYSENGIFESNPIEDYDANIGLDRYNLRSNVDMDLTSTTKLSVDMSGQYRTKNSPGWSSGDIFYHIAILPTHLIPMQWSDGTAAVVRDDGYSRYNPYNMLNHSGYTKEWAAFIQSKVALEQQLDFITKGLSIKGILSFDADFNSAMKRSKSAHTYYVLGRNSDGTLNKVTKDEGSALSDPTLAASGGTKKLYIETSLNYKRTFNQHDVTGLLLYNQKETRYANVDGVSLLPYRKQSVVARGAYSYANRYMLEASFGATGSENFIKGKRWGIFPAVGAAWYVSHEEFMRSVEDYISSLKVRVSYGITGNDEIGSDVRFPYREALNEAGASYNFGLTPGVDGGASNSFGSSIMESTFAAPNLTWETEKKFNAGIDVGLFNERITLSADYFFNKRDNILINRKTVPLYVGFRTNPYQNFGITHNQGVDASIILKQNIGDWVLSARGNLTYAKNEVVEYDEISQAYPWLQYTGNPIGQPKVYIAEGLFTPDDFDIIPQENGGNLYTLKKGIPAHSNNVQPGDIKYKDLNGDGKIDSMDQTYDNGLYPSTPQIVYGFGLNVEYKGFFAGIFFQGAAKTSVNLLSNAGVFVPFYNGKDNSPARAEGLNHWKASDPYNQNVLFPRLRTANSFENNYVGSTWWYRNGNFLRLKNVEFGYQFDKKWTQRFKVQNLRLYIQGTNLAVWDNIKIWDPEQGSSSGTAYPVGTTWTFGAEVTF